MRPAGHSLDSPGADYKHSLKGLHTKAQRILLFFLSLASIYQNPCLVIFTDATACYFELFVAYPRQRQRTFPLASLSRPALRPSQPSVQWVLGVLSPGEKHSRLLSPLVSAWRAWTVLYSTQSKFKT
jgi:hypothetical protein